MRKTIFANQIHSVTWMEGAL